MLFVKDNHEFQTDEGYRALPARTQRMGQNRALTAEEMKDLAEKALQYLGDADLLRAHFGARAPEQLHDLAFSSIRQAYAAWQELDGVDHVEEAYALPARDIINHAAFKRLAEKTMPSSFKAAFSLHGLGMRKQAKSVDFPFLNACGEPQDEPWTDDDGNL